ncbi:negative cofactor 2 complex subunit alpha [Ricinus communis]|uniref:DNA binding protein, putative n=1 Tax=Ricinus communis TaxID=3988 RepID=B9RMF4_RICCO|nr:negative cofactor 2 complex subunit alpha [Ricinus communis]EEF47477.1 DNA binding protein, putative [Ricinus communis]|eukprot:XP_002514923.1 negative cofactor 2 complex subunit alpha [Ricinus communis]
MAEEENTVETIRPEFPTGRVKKIMKLDKDINKVTSDALFLVSRSTELFLRLLAEKSAEVATEQKRKTIKLDHIRIAVKRHQPTSDFLLDSLPSPTESSDKLAAEKNRSRLIADKPAPPGTRRIDEIFAKSANEAPIQINDN